MIKNVLNYEEALKNAKDYFQGDDLAGSVFISKYATTEDNMYSESTPKEMHMRMAKEYARIEEKMGGENKLSTETIFKLFNDWTIIPGGSVMNGLGNPSYIGSLSNCFVAPPPQDSYSSIMNNRETLVQLMKRRGGVGIDISHLRPSGAKVNNAAKSSTGAVSFMNVYSELTKEVALCIEGTQRVLTPFGMKEIKDVIVGDFVWTRLGFIKVINTYDNGIRPVYKTKTKFGYEIETTDDHVFLTCNENGLVEKKISEFVVDEPICMLNGCNISGEEQTLTHDLYAPKIGRISNQFGTYGEMVYDNTLKTNIPTKLDKKLAYLIGYAIGDGYTNKASSKNDDGNLTLTVSCNSNDVEIINKIIKYTKDVFDVDCKPIKKNNENCVKIRIVCNEGCCFLNENGLLKPTTEFLRIPKKIFNSNTEIQMAFFSGLFDADGYASGRKKGYVLITVNENLKNDVQKLLLSNGVMSKCHIEEPKNKKWKTKYCVTVVGKYNQQKLVDLCTESIKISNLNFVSKRDCYLSPYTIKSASLLKESFIPSDGFVSVNTLSRSTSYKDGILTQDYFKSLDYVGEKHVYDIELESEHLFWCEGFYVHNCGRRGALMISMSGKHPDIDEFIRVKQDLTKITGANVSVKFDDEFMNAVINDDYYIQRFPIDLDISSIDKDSLPLNQKVFDGSKCYKKVKAKEIWNEFALCSWRTAEPGIMYEDKHLNYSPDSVYEEYKGITTNPCGEIFMDPNNSCRLMHINFANFVENPFTENAYFDYDKLAKYAGYNMRLCDDLVELELEYVTKIIEKIKSTYTDENQAELKLWETIRDKGEKSRRAGCGGTGLADAIAMLNLKFGSKESLDVINKIFHAKMWGELQMQTILAKERGAFFGFDFKKEFIENNNGYTGTNEFFTFITKEFPEEIENIKNYGRRNVSWSTMAPVGSVSLLTQTTSGIEPLFSAFYKRRKKVSSPNDRVDFIDNTGEKFTEYFVIHKPFENWIKKYSGLCTNNQNVDLNSLTEETLTELFNKSPWGGASASELTPLQHIETQTIAQKYTTHSISKTINLPENATVDEVSQLYIDGWKQNLKGVTIYRDNCRAGVMVKSDSKCECKTTLTHNAPKRPKTMKCDIKRFKNGGEKWIAAIGLMDKKPYEIFTGLAEKLNIPEYVTEAEIIKNKINKIVEDEDTGEMVEKKVSRYDIRYIDTNGKKVTIEGLSTIFNPVFYNYSKLISGLLRHGMGVQYIVSTIKSMNFKDNNINSWKNGVIRSLKQYLEDGEIKGESCPSCGGKISRINGCKTCTNCGWSACS